MLSTKVGNLVHKKVRHRHTQAHIKFEIAQMIRVLYDISMFGKRNIPHYRTGIYRTVENLARGLAASPECELTFCIGPEIDAGFEHLTEDAQLHLVPFAISRSLRIRRRLHQSITNLTGSIETSRSRSARFYRKGVRKLLYHAYQTTRSHSIPVGNKTLERADIFHSPFHAIPTQVRNAFNLKRFLTLYDLIAIRWPELFETTTGQYINLLLNSLDPEDFSLCISESTKNDLCNYRPDLKPDRIFVTPLGASDNFRPCTNANAIAAVKNKYGIPPDIEYVLSLCTLEPRKNLEQAIRCFARVVQQEHLKDLRLVLVGPKGWDYDRIFKAAKAHSISEYIIFTDFVEDEDLSPLYSGALAFIYLSLYEGFGLPPLEAMQCGAPVVTSNTSSLPEVVGDAGKMFDPMDADGICQALLDVYRDPAQRKVMRQRSLERAKLFGWERCTRETIAAYRNALAR
jgi:glycosyltransferase involved in cell wall biosynthesis